MIHKTRIVMVKADVDIGIAQMVEDLNQISGVRTHASCQGTIGEGGSHPYRAYVLCSWESETALEVLRSKYIVTPHGNGAWGYVHPQATLGLPDGGAPNDCVPAGIPGSEL